MDNICQCCKGKGNHFAKIMNCGTREFEEHIVPCIVPGCENGIVDRKENYRILWGN